MYLHIGTPKSGTTYLQGALEHNRDKLAAHGVLWPGSTWADQVRAVRDLADIHPFDKSPADVAGAWQRLVDEIHAWQGHSTVVSMEWLVGAQPKHIQRAVDTLAPARVEVVVTARDLARVIPASWQEAMQNWSIFTWDEYLAALKDPESAGIHAGRRLWRQQDLGDILRRWGQAVPAERMHVVTVPAPGGDPGRLWQRFAGVIGIDTDDYAPPPKERNTSLGVVSAELMRRFNASARARRMTWKQHEYVAKQLLAKQVLSRRAGLEPALALPADYYPWVIDHGKRLVAEVEQAGVRVTGDLTELIPDPAHAREGVTPDAISDRELLEAALDGTIGLVDEASTEPTNLPDRLSDTVGRLGVLSGRRR